MTRLLAPLALLALFGAGCGSAGAATMDDLAAFCSDEAAGQTVTGLGD